MAEDGKNGFLKMFWVNYEFCGVQMCMTQLKLEEICINVKGKPGKVKW